MLQLFQRFHFQRQWVSFAVCVHLVQLSYDLHHWPANESLWFPISYIWKKNKVRVLMCETCEDPPLRVSVNRGAAQSSLFDYTAVSQIQASYTVFRQDSVKQPKGSGKTVNCSCNTPQCLPVLLIVSFWFSKLYQVRGSALPGNTHHPTVNQGFSSDFSEISGFIVRLELCYFRADEWWWCCGFLGSGDLNSCDVQHKRKGRTKIEKRKKVVLTLMVDTL